mmetsp:Transcript_4293/g.10072  ORF Transcript_4293/g.10072 Transcript_4293/m.10072 type:complete len:357 (+) Transcript_4293:320-1390(+)
MLDCDTYDPSNLTRQCLGSIEDVGKRKVDAAAENIKCHNIRSEIETIHLDALAHWDEVVKIARKCTVLFNGIDLGAMWDYCVCSLAKELGIPYVAGQSYDWMFNVEYYSGNPAKICAWCAEAKSAEEWLTNQFRTHFGFGGDLKYVKQRLEDFMKSREKKVLDEYLLVEFLRVDKEKFKMYGPTVPKLVSEALGKVIKARKVAGPKKELEIDELAAFLEALMFGAVNLLLPGSISKLSEVQFIPHPSHVETRFVGSWVCPCLAAGCIMVSQFANALTGRKEDSGDPPCNITFNLGWGQTVEEKGYQDTAKMVRAGIFPTDSLDSITEERPRASSPAKTHCMLCSSARKVQASMEEG